MKKGRENIKNDRKHIKKDKKICKDRKNIDEADIIQQDTERYLKIQRGIQRGKRDFYAFLLLLDLD